MLPDTKGSVSHPWYAAEAQAEEALDVFPGGAQDADTGVGVVGPGDGDANDFEAALLGDEQQLCVQEPGVVYDVGQDALGGLAGDGFEAALGVGEAAAEHELNEYVVAAGGDLSLEGALVHLGPLGQAGAVSYIRAVLQGLDHEWEGPDVGGEVNVHVAEDGGGALQPGLLQGAAPATLLQADVGDVREQLRELLADVQGAVNGAVVGDDDAVRVGDGLGEELPKPGDAHGQGLLFVQHGDDDVYGGVRAGHALSLR